MQARCALATLAIILLLPATTAMFPSKLSGTEEFIDWLQSNDAHLHAGLQIAEVDGRRGLYIEGGCEPNTNLAVIPPEITVSISTANSSLIAPLLNLIRSRSSLRDTSIIPMFLLHERLRHDRSGSTFWSPWLRILPEKVGLPVEWDQAERDAIRNFSPMLHQCLEHVHLDYIDRLYSALKQVAFDSQPELFPAPSPQLLQTRFRWAYAIMLSRGHGLDTPAVLPLLDLLNHEQAAAGHLAMVPSGGRVWELVANRRYAGTD